MEENKDINSLIGFTLMGAVMLLWLWTQPPIEENITNDVIESQDFEEDDLSAPDNLIVDDIILNDNNDVSFNNSSEISDNDIYSFDNELISLEINCK